MKTFCLIGQNFDWAEAVVGILIPNMPSDINQDNIHISAKVQYTSYPAAERVKEHITREISRVNRNGNNLLVELKTEISQIHQVYPDSTDSYKVTVNGQPIKCVGIKNPEIDKFLDLQTIDIRYRLFDPKPKKAAPLVLWLHGMGEIGIDNRQQVSNNYLPRWVTDGNQKKFGKEGAFVVAPQSAHGKHNTKHLKDLIDILLQSYNIDRNRIYIGGCSMGGMCTNMMLKSYPNIFAAAFVVCPVDAITERTAKKIAAHGISVYNIHSIDDHVCQASNSILTANRIKNAGGSAYVALFKNVVLASNPKCKSIGTIKRLGHSSWIYLHNNFSGDISDWQTQYFHQGEITLKHIELSYKNKPVKYSKMYLVNNNKIAYKNKLFEQGDLTSCSNGFSKSSVTVTGISESPSSLGYKDFFTWLASQHKKNAR